MEIIERALQIYGNTQSIKETARILQISEQVVRRYLINAGAYTSPQIASILSLHEEGKTVPEICSLLNISRSAVQSVLPYTKGTYKAPPSENALKIRQTRAKQRSPKP